MSNNKVQERSGLKKIFRRYIHAKNGKIVYPKGKCFVLYVKE